ncbi:leucine-rich repeat and immunoglobulin-like domain-containing nogo receptor-interacting protein 2 [Limulus polyphemus]|uniref:Leucine-rich repeat and immunoglobulin-like domain-containing nogo receptor-interacting protein 2 n=1 Tax=Limulus polyphemus TaxID=6850 RepID=A0ABM1THZ0_LIMPO|nr:leucine-rich repeat and immunoglobulin-like domain-containing nogo receptor-interacting protein 2 [Limulus polyphemus]
MPNMRLKITFFTCILIFTYQINVTKQFGNECPSPEDIYPCECERRHGDKTYLVCKELFVSRDLEIALKASQKVDLYGLSIQDSTIQYLPSDEFDGTLFEEFELKNTGLTAITDGEHAFKGLEDRLKYIEIRDCRFLNSWSWKAFSKINSLRLLQFIGGDLRTLSSDFSILSRNKMLATVNMNLNEIRSLDKHVFSQFPMLLDIYLQGNKIETIERSMFPNPAQLSFMNFASNKISRLPDDVFSNMPRLRIVLLYDNQLTTLSEVTFKPIWNQLIQISLENNDIICDCRLIWIVDNQGGPRKVEGNCKRPDFLEGRTLTSLNERDLHC